MNYFYYVSLRSGKELIIRSSLTLTELNKYKIQGVKSGIFDLMIKTKETSLEKITNLALVKVSDILIDFYSIETITECKEKIKEEKNGEMKC